MLRYLDRRNLPELAQIGLCLNILRSADLNLAIECRCLVNSLLLTSAHSTHTISGTFLSTLSCYGRDPNQEEHERGESDWIKEEIL